jgi:multidrug efflux system membrane fusion protein
VDPGNIVHATDTTGIVVVTQLQPIAVIFTLPQEDLADINAALAAGPVKVMTLSREGNKELDQGTLTLLDNEINPATGTLRLKATFSNARYTLWPGPYVNVHVLVRTDHDAITIPTTAVMLGPDGPFTFVVKNDSTVEVRPITLGEQNENRTVITKGLAVNEHVVTSNQYRLQAGAHVRLGSAAAPKPT